MDVDKLTNDRLQALLCDRFLMTNLNAFLKDAV